MMENGLRSLRISSLIILLFMCAVIVNCHSNDRPKFKGKGDAIKAKDSGGSASECDTKIEFCPGEVGGTNSGGSSTSGSGSATSGGATSNSDDLGASGGSGTAGTTTGGTGEATGGSDTPSSCTDKCPILRFDNPGRCMNTFYFPDGSSGMRNLCLDNAGCKGDNCKIWCPGQPCDSGRHPEGCPQGVEAVFVAPDRTNYADACREGCEMRIHRNLPNKPHCNTDATWDHRQQHPECYACWDSQYNVCRYPGECGSPL